MPLVGGALFQQFRVLVKKRLQVGHLVHVGGQVDKHTVEDCLLRAAWIALPEPGNHIRKILGRNHQVELGGFLANGRLGPLNVNTGSRLSLLD